MGIVKEMRWLVQVNMCHFVKRGGMLQSSCQKTKQTLEATMLSTSCLYWQAQHQHGIVEQRDWLEYYWEMFHVCQTGLCLCGP